MSPLVADVRQKLADARQERVEFGETFEHLVKVGVLDRARMPHRSSQKLHPVNQLAQDLGQEWPTWGRRWPSAIKPPDRRNRERDGARSRSAPRRSDRGCSRRRPRRPVEP